jgi:hypothetical protein
MEEGGVENTRLETNPYRKFFLNYSMV